MVDLHMHTIYSDGENSIEEMVQTSIMLGLKKIAITDHIWRCSEWFDNYCNEIASLRRKYPQLEILIGFEAKALSINGEIDATEYMCTKADIRIGAIHRIPKGEKIGEFLTKNEVLENKELAYNNWLTATKNMIRNKFVDIVAHPFMVLTKYRISPVFKDTVDLFLLAFKYNKKLEFSFKHRNSNIYLIKLIKKFPFFLNLISYGSDSHSVDELMEACLG